MEKKQTMRFNDAELSLIQNTFKDDSILKELRKYSLQMESNVEVLKVKPVTDLLRKVFLPTLDGNAPMHQVIDLWLTVKIGDKSPVDALPIIRSREILINHFDAMLTQLEGGKAKGVSLDKLTVMSKEDWDCNAIYSNLLARNEIVSHTEQQISQLSILANQTKEQLEAQMKKNSSK